MSAREPLLVLPSADPEDKRGGDGASRHPPPLHMRIVTLLYGASTSDDALVHAGFYAVLMCAIVGVYWLLRSLKDSVFATVVGLEYQPIAKMSSLAVVTVLLLLYNKAVDLLAAKGPQRGSGVGAPLFAAVFSCYAAVFLAVAVGLASTRYGLYGPSGEPLPPSPYRLLGWVFYFAIESYGTLSVSLFWQFVNSQVAVKAAKSQYGIIVAGGQVGAIGGCTIVISCRSLGVPNLAGLGALLTLLPVLLLRGCSASASARGGGAGGGGGGDSAPHSPHDAPHHSGGGGGGGGGRVKPGLLEGARLVCAHRYVAALCVSTSLYKVMATIMDYQMQVLLPLPSGASAPPFRCLYPSPRDAGARARRAVDGRRLRGLHGPLRRRDQHGLAALLAARHELHAAHPRAKTDARLVPALPRRRLGRHPLPSRRLGNVLPAGRVLRMPLPPTSFACPCPRGCAPPISLACPCGCAPP